MESPRRVIAIATFAALLMAANLTLDVAALWLSEKVWRNSPDDQVPIGFILGQLMLMALWLGLGDGRWYMRLVIAVAFTLSLGQALSVAGRLTAISGSNEPDNSMAVAFIFMSMMLAVSCLAFVIRRAFGWRLTWAHEMGAQPLAQFQIGDTLLWMLIIGGALAAIRFVFTLDESWRDSIGDIVKYTIMTSVVTTAAMAASIQRWSWKGWILFLVLIALTGIGGAVPEAFQRIQALRATAGPLNPMVYAATWLNESQRPLACAAAVAACVMANCLVLKRLGCKLQRAKQTVA